MANFTKIVSPGEAAAGDNPLVTYHIQCFRQERFIGEAVRSVLAQTYRPLEVVISDDASPDRTFELIFDLARAYSGPHRVVVHRSEHNRGISSHANETFPLISGKFFVWLSGDDTVERDQVERLAAVWRSSGASGVFSNSQMIDEEGRALSIQLPEGHSCMLGLTDYTDGRHLDFPYSGTIGYSREVIDRFGPIDIRRGQRGLEHEFGFRAALLGHKRYLPLVLMSRRDHPGRASYFRKPQVYAEDPMTAHEQQIARRLQVLRRCRALAAAPNRKAGEPARSGVVEALTGQILTEERRLLEYAVFRARRARAIAAGSTPPRHSGEYTPNTATFIRALPDHRRNLIAAECRYFAVPFELGPIEPCLLRNNRYPRVVSAWTEGEILQILAGANGT